MPTPFETASAMTSAAVDRVYGESFQMIAMKPNLDVDALRIPDPARPAFTAVGAYVAPSQAVYPHARGAIADDHAQKLVASQPLASFDNAALAWPVTTGDRVLRLKTGELFEVARPLPDGVRRTVLHLTSRKRA